MDLPSCPACDQSVLEEAASHCPFCGASMTGDGVAATPPSPTDTVPSDDPSSIDDPFAVDTSVAHRSLPAASAPSKTRPWRITCPMCDTAGFIPRQAAGREIKCANPKCLVPIFTAPPAPTPPSRANDKPSRQGSGQGSLLALAIMLVAGLAGATWWYLRKPPATSRPESPIASSAMPQFGEVLAATTDDANTGRSQPPPAIPDNTATKVPGATITVKQVRAQAYAAMVAAAQRPERPDDNRSKPFCRRVNAETFASMGSEAETLVELKQLTEVGADLSHLHITPLVALWWSNQGTAQPKRGPRLEDALKRSVNLSSRDTYAVDAAIALGTALVSTGQKPLAAEIIDRLWLENETQRLRLDQLAARHSAVFSLIASAPDRTFLPSARSPDTLIIRHLVARGHSATALAWSRRRPQPLIRGDQLAAWASAEYRATGQAAVSRISKALVDESALIRARVLARTALLAIAADPVLANELAAAAEAALKQCPPPRTVVLGDLRQTYLQKVDDATTWWLQVQAYACLVATRSIGGDLPSARSLFQTALSMARSIGPTQEDVLSRINAMKSMGSSRFLQKIKTALDLTGNDAAQQAAQDYRRQCTTWHELAGQRAECLDRLHRWAVGFGLIDVVWEDVRKFVGGDDISRRDLFSITTLPSFLFLRFKAAGNNNALQQMNTTFSTATPTDSNERLRQETEAALTTDNPIACVQAITKDAATRGDRAARFARRRLMFHLVGRAAVSEQPAAALGLIENFRDPRLAIWREEAYRLVAAQLATHRHHAIVWTHAMASHRTPTERIALLAGLLEGLKVAGRIARERT